MSLLSGDPWKDKIQTVIDVDMNVPKKKIIFHIGIQQNGLILLYLLIIREHAIITKKNLRAGNQKETVSNIIKKKLTELVSSDFCQNFYLSRWYTISYIIRMEPEKAKK